MPEIVKTVNFIIIENTTNSAIRKTHTEFATAVERPVVFISTLSNDVIDATTALKNGHVDGVLISPSLVGHDQLLVEGLNLDTPSAVIGCYNLLKLSDNAIRAVNTDVMGVHYAMTSTCVHPYFRSVLVIGTGPLVRAALYCLVHYFQTNVVHVYEESEYAFNTIKGEVLRIGNNVVVVRHRQINSSPNVSCVVTDIPRDIQTTARVNHIRMLLSITFEKYHDSFAVDQKNILLNLGHSGSESDLSPWSFMAIRGGWKEISLELVEKIQTQIMWQQVTTCDNDLLFHECSWVKDSTV
ncbi:hypothetical protein K435DRAFT_864276 [Dendrothele bispora CBS 962.96]|uniref:NAD(P)-binding protein n=1 Tax=Dendrothele bispora (strain CBS 962.96) TaxID=1314807 RepID=A0A4S8LMZ5_DENBC|nr:hypothetical protein K435DRAFT_864276 [Dendrothele bispora CBS 962.96]